MSDSKCSFKTREPIRLLTTLNANYIPQLQVLLTSIAINNPQERFELYLLHSDIPQPALDGPRDQCAALGYALHAVQVQPDLLRDAPVTKRYPREMYYRLLAAHLLSQDVDRMLYLDPDILVINPLRPLWDMDMKGMLFAAASRTELTEISNNVNRLRLGTDSDYFNSGVLLMDLAACRKEIVPAEVMAYAAEHSAELVLPDQDILNAMYGARILPLDDFIWNYDARDYRKYLLCSLGRADMEWVIANTVILHFCGRAKPWKPGYPYRFGMLYRHYMHLTNRLFSNRPIDCIIK